MKTKETYSCPNCGGSLYEDEDGFVTCDTCEYAMPPYPPVDTTNPTYETHRVKVWFGDAIPYSQDPFLHGYASFFVPAGKEGSVKGVLLKKNVPDGVVLTVDMGIVDHDVVDYHHSLMAYYLSVYGAKASVKDNGKVVLDFVSKRGYEEYGRDVSFVENEEAKDAFLCAASRKE